MFACRLAPYLSLLPAHLLQYCPHRNVRAQGCMVQGWAGRSASGKVLEEILMRLVARKYVSLAAACGCVRAAYTDHQISLAARDLHTAAFLCRALRHGCHVPSQDGRGQETAHAVCADDLQAMYASCGVSLMDLLPKVTSPDTTSVFSHLLGRCSAGLSAERGASAHQICIT